MSTNCLERSERLLKTDKATNDLERSKRLRKETGQRIASSEAESNDGSFKVQIRTSGFIIGGPVSSS